MEASGNSPFVDWLHRRIGWWIIVVFPLFMWVLNGCFQIIGVYLFARAVPLSTAQVVDIGRWLGLVWVVMVVGSLIHAAIATRPLWRFNRGEIEPEAAWRSVAAIPGRYLRFNYGIGVVAGPLGLWGIAQVVPLDIPTLTFWFFALLGLWLYALPLTTFAATLWIRPVLRSIASDLHGARPPKSGIRLFSKLIFVVPALSVATAVFGVILGLEPHQDFEVVSMRLFLVTVLATVATVPVTLLFARSVNLPIEDLIAGTRRVKAGDYSQPVPALSTDELGELALSFNEAMEGLAERQQLAWEVRASRARIVAAADDSRKRIERNLHDGAQQRLVALALDLKLLEENADGDMAHSLHQAGESVKEALTELRELARGLHPQILTTDGLGPALSQLASRSKVPVRVDVPTQRFSEPVETAAYFVVAEALANVAKYAKARSAQVTVQSSNGSLQVEVADDGIGGASLGEGTGLAGLADRVAALDGRLTIDSPVGLGTKVRATIPVEKVGAETNLRVTSDGEATKSS